MRLSALSDLVRAFAIASASGTYRQEDGELIGTGILHQAVIRPRLRSDAQPVLPLGELRDLDNYLALGVTYDKGGFRWRGALLVLGEVDAYRWIIPLISSVLPKMMAGAFGVIWRFFSFVVESVRLSIIGPTVATSAFT